MANTVKAYICIECKVGFTKEVVEGLKQLKGIKSVEMVTGPYDVIAILERDSLHEIGDSITQHIQLVNGITRTVTCLVV